MQDVPKINDASFRDPNGFVVESNGEIYRLLNPQYNATYDKFMTSGLYEALVDEKIILEHEAINVTPGVEHAGKRSIRQVKIPLITYPYEWSFDMYKEAALATLRCQEIAYSFGMELQDASAYNIQFYNSHPVLIDITSFIETNFTQWRAYRQFCEHFVAPLALMAKKDLRLSSLMQSFIDGIPLDLASSVMPKSTFGSFGLGLHVHAHAKMNSKKISNSEPKKIGLGKNLAMIDSLKGCIKGLETKQNTEWGKYYDDTNYSDTAFDSKKQIVSEFINGHYPEVVVDLGANDGVFSEIAARNAFTISLDIDPNAVNSLYNKKITNIQPVLGNIATPSPSIGWGNKERPGILERIKDQNAYIIALALVHHLRITYGIPFEKQFELLANLGKRVLVEYVSRNDSQVKLMMNGRDESMYDDYNRGLFEKAATKYFTMKNCTQIEDSERMIYELHV